MNSTPRQSCFTLLVAALTVLITSSAYAQSSLRPTTVEAKNGAITTSIAAHYDELVKADKKVVEEYADGVFQLRGWGIANTIAIDAKDGFIIVDTGDSIQAATQMRAKLEKLVGHKIKVAAILYTHHHYVSGTSVWADKGVRIIAHEYLDRDKKADQGLSIYSGNVAVRGLTQFGFLNPLQGADAFPNLLGSTIEKLTHKSGYLKATETVADGTLQELNVAGERVEIAECKIDVQNSICFYFPDRSTLVTNFMASPSFFNLYSLRGDIYRYPMAYVAASDWALSKNARYVLDIHNAGKRERKSTQQALEESRDQMQILHDQTLRLIAKGFDARRVAENIYIPAVLLKDRETFGQIESHVKQVYNAKIGWMGNDIYDINPLRVNNEVQRTIQLMGGQSKVLSAAITASKSSDIDDWKWAILLSSQLLELDSSNREIKHVRAIAARKLGQHTTSANARGWYITEALAMEGNLFIGPQAVTREALRVNFGKATIEKVLASPIEDAVNYIRYLIDPKVAEGRRFDFNLDFTDTPYKTNIEVRHGVIAITAIKSSSKTVKLSRDNWADFVVAGTTDSALLTVLNEVLVR